MQVTIATKSTLIVDTINPSPICELQEKSVYTKRRMRRIQDPLYMHMYMELYMLHV